MLPCDGPDAEAASKLNTLFKMFGLEARAYSNPPRILWKERNVDYGGGMRASQMVHELRFFSFEELNEEAHRRLREAQGLSEQLVD